MEGQINKLINYFILENKFIRSIYLLYLNNIYSIILIDKKGLNKIEFIINLLNLFIE